MPFQPINFASIAPRQNTAVSDMLGNIMQGYQQASIPEQMRMQQALKLAEIMKQQQLAQKAQQEAQFVSPLAESLINQRGSQGRSEDELANLRHVQSGLEPERIAAYIKQQQSAARAHEAQARKTNKEADNPFMLAGGLSGVGREAMGLDLIGKTYGTNSEVYSNAKRAYDSNLNSADVLNRYRSGLTDTQDKRASTTLGKTGLEAQDIAAGFLPGSGRSVRLSNEQQAQLQDQYGLQTQKIVSDSDARKKALYASNIDKTLATIDTKALTQYAGLPGTIKKKIEEGKAPLGKESKDYREYQKALNGATVLAKQIRQFYGDSITPGIQSGIKMLTDPATWKNNPAIAEQNFKNLRSILNKETGTYRGALTGTSEFRDNNSQGDTVHTVERINGKLVIK